MYYQSIMYAHTCILKYFIHVLLVVSIFLDSMFILVTKTTGFFHHFFLLHHFE